MELRDIDLNHLVVFHELMIERRVSRVADKLGLTQPAISNTLAKLRKTLGDDLFVRAPGGMLPTPWAEQLSEPVREALALIHGGLNPADRFDPATCQQALTIGMTDIGEIVFLPALMERLRREAPGVTLSTVRNTSVNLQDEMASGKVDLAIGLLPQLKAGFFQRRLFPQRYVCLFRRGHPLDGRKVSLPGFRSAEHVLVVSAGTGHGQIDARIQRAGIDRKVRLTVPHFVSVGHLLQRSDLVATVPEQLARHLAAPFDLVYRPHPLKLPAFQINVFWHAKAHRAAMNQWLRGVVVDLFADKGD